MPDVSGDRRLELVIEPRSADYDPDDDRWRAQVGTLHQELAAQVDTYQRGRSSPGTKGTVDQLIVALGSSGALTAAVECFRAWLQRDKSRSIDVRWDEDGQERHVTFSGDNVDAATVQAITRAAAGTSGRRGVAGTYRALLIGNSTYPADEHNLQPLRDRSRTSPRSTARSSTRTPGCSPTPTSPCCRRRLDQGASRALGKFFAGADRDDVLLMYFSGHGKLDQNGRLHLCMQDTETTDLLSTRGEQRPHQRVRRCLARPQRRHRPRLLLRRRLPRR